MELFGKIIVFIGKNKRTLIFHKKIFYIDIIKMGRKTITDDGTFNYYNDLYKSLENGIQNFTHLFESLKNLNIKDDKEVASFEMLLNESINQIRKEAYRRVSTKKRIDFKANSKKLPKLNIEIN